MSQKTAGEIGEDKKQEIGANIKSTRCVKKKNKSESIFASILANTNPEWIKIRMTMVMLVVTNRESAVEHLVLEDVGEGGGVPGEEVGVPR